MMFTLQQVFKHQEVLTTKSLQAIYLVLFFDLVYTFSDWINQKYLTIESVKTNHAVCWPYFQNCLDLYVFSNIPHGYSLPILYMVMGGFMFLSLFYAYKNQWNYALCAFATPVIFKFLMIYVFSYLPTGNFNVLSVLIALVFLFARDKIFNLKVLLTTFYLCAVVIKFNPGYLTGSIFSSLELGVPILPDALIPYYGYIFIFLLIFAPLYLWSGDKRMRNFAVGALVLFHVYTITLVGFRFPTLCVPLIFLLFVMAGHESFSLKRLLNDRFTSIIVLLLIIMQLIPLMIFGDSRISSEGEKYGFYMYTANRQCVRTMNLTYTDGTVVENTFEERRGMWGCDPYIDWFKIKNKCRETDVKNIEWIFNVSINGSYFYTLVDTKDACSIKEYSPFKHNEWIKFDTLDTSIPVLKNSI